MKISGRRLKMMRYISKLRNHKWEGLLFYPVYSFHFGWKRAIELAKVRKNRDNWLCACKKFIKDDFSDIIEKYRNVTISEQPQSPYVWVCWLQGEDDMPELVKNCIQSIKSGISDSQIFKLITFDNLDQYAQFPDYIWKNLKSGKLPIAHFSDIIRFTLLSKYGGLWVDSTIFLSSKINSDMWRGG